MNILANITLFVIVMLLTIGFVYKATAAEPAQDTENTCHQTNSCKSTGSTDNPFEENANELR